MSLRDVVEVAYRRWGAGEVDAFLDLFVDGALFAVPGATRLSGDHDKAAFREVLAELAGVTGRGEHRQERICTYEGDGGVVAVLDNHVVVDGSPVKYHSVHEWIGDGGSLRAWMLYVHEYDVFARAWA